MPINFSPEQSARRRPISAINKVLSHFAIAGAMLLALPAYALDPVSLFVNQCLDYNEKFNVDFANATTLERKTLGLQNLSDRVQYYRQFHLSSDDNEWLLQCQLAVASTTSSLLKSTELDALLTRAATYHGPQAAELHGLVSRYRYLQQHQLQEADKIAATSAQTAIKQRLASNSFSVDLGNCALPAATSDAEQQTTEQQDKPQQLNQSIARYLLKQPDESCRQKVWQAYQTRAVPAVKADLAKLVNIQTQQAMAIGFQSYSDMLFANTLMGNAANATAFLQAMGRNVAVTPWNIGVTLKAAAKTPAIALNRMQYLHKLTDALTPLDVTLEHVNEQWLRLWHRQRLLGDVMLTNGVPHAIEMRRAVVGHQTGIAYLSLPAEFKSVRQLKRADSAMAQIITSMAAGSRFSLVNGFKLPQDSQQLAQHWLTDYLEQQYRDSQFSTDYSPGSREALYHSYQAQFERLNALAALKFYGQSSAIDLTQAFNASFGQPWADSNTLPYSFAGIADAGPLYYSHMFQRQLAKALRQHTQNCAPAMLFEQLVVNEQQQPVVALLGKIWPQGIQQFIAELHHRAADAPHAPLTSVNTINQHSSNTFKHCPL